MEIQLTPKQWENLKKAVTQGMAVERRMKKPIEISNGNISIEIKEDVIDIVLMEDK